MILQYLTT